MTGAMGRKEEVEREKWKTEKKERQERREGNNERRKGGDGIEENK